MFLIPVRFNLLYIQYELDLDALGTTFSIVGLQFKGLDLAGIRWFFPRGEKT